MLKPSLMGVPTGKPPVQQYSPGDGGSCCEESLPGLGRREAPMCQGTGVQNDGQTLAKSKCASGFQVALFCLFLPDGSRPPPLSCQYWDFFRSFLTWEADQLCGSLSAHSLPQSHIPGLLLAAIYFSSTDGFIKAILLICKKSIQVVAGYAFKMQIRLCRWHKITAAWRAAMGGGTDTNTTHSATWWKSTFSACFLQSNASPWDGFTLTWRQTET